jgi:hypothetical protein
MKQIYSGNALQAIALVAGRFVIFFSRLIERRRSNVALVVAAFCMLWLTTPCRPKNQGKELTCTNKSSFAHDSFSLYRRLDREGCSGRATVSGWPPSHDDGPLELWRVEANV